MFEMNIEENYKLFLLLLPNNFEVSVVISLGFIIDFDRVYRISGRFRNFVDKHSSLEMVNPKS